MSGSAARPSQRLTLYPGSPVAEHSIAAQPHERRAPGPSHQLTPVDIPRKQSPAAVPGRRRGINIFCERTRRSCSVDIGLANGLLLIEEHDIFRMDRHRGTREDHPKATRLFAFFVWKKRNRCCPPEVRFAVSPWRAPAANAGRGI